MAKISVLGAGTWGVALAKLLNDNGHEVTIWSALEREITELATTHGQKNLPGFVLPDNISLTTDLTEALADREILVMSVASTYTRSTAARLKGLIPDGQVIVAVAKGIEERTLMTQTEIIEDELPSARVCVLSGPSHAEEVSIGLPTTCVIGSRSKSLAEHLAEVFSNSFFRVYTSPDVKAIELGGSLKNVIALAAGIADGLGYGDNAKAALITRGIVEITRLGTAMGGNSFTFYGLSGIGDLIVTCASMHSRNRRAGILIGKGYTCEEAMKEVQMVVEGVYSAKAALALSRKYNIEMPIVEEVNSILFEGKPAKDAYFSLMKRDLRIEHGEIQWEEA
jgi:glycerol-3-phosphate dehydrogenase (NAD(P)+)